MGTVCILGIDTNSLRRVEQHLQVLNKERPAAHMHSDDAIGARFLACITFPPVLQADAFK